MKAIGIRVVVVVIVASALTMHMALAQSPGIGRTELTRRDLGDSQREVVQVRVDFAPGAGFPRHSHPGVEVAYVLEGTLEYEFDGKPPVTLGTGASLFIPAGVIHSAQNRGNGAASELATYVVDKGKPSVAVAP